MKQTTNRLLCLLLSVVMIFSFAACGKTKSKGDSDGPKDPNLLKIDEYSLLYKGGKIVKDYSGNDAVVLTLDFTNNSDFETSYLWAITDMALQNDIQMERASIFLDSESADMITDTQYDEVKPGETLEVNLAYVLIDMTTEIEVRFEDLMAEETVKLTVDPSTLTKDTGSESGSSSTETGTTASASTGDALLDWWNGDWYGWWVMTGCYGYYEELEGQSWDVCGTVEIGEDYIGTVTLWDEEYTKAEPMVSAAISLNESGTGEHGTVMSEGGNFTDIALEHADWIVDPGLLEYENMIHIDGFYENGDDQFTYDIFLRPWGTRWDDVTSDDLPYLYQDWYLPLVDAGKSMPDSFDAAASTEGTATTDATKDTNTSVSAPATTPADAPNGDGIVTQEQVEKGYVWMSEVAKDIYHTTYEELAAYFGVDGQFVKEEYSDHMQENRRYYKWISSENKNHFIYVNFAEEEPGVFVVCAFNTSGFSGSEALAKYLDVVKAEEAEVDKAAASNTAMKDFTLEVKQFAKDDVKVTITTTIPESGWSSTKDSLVENEDPTAFGAGEMVFTVRDSVEKFDNNKNSFKNYQDIEDRVIGGITFKGRTYEYIGYSWIEYVAQIDEGRALSIGLAKMDCFPGTMPDIILNNMTFA